MPKPKIQPDIISGGVASRINNIYQQNNNVKLNQPASAGEENLNPESRFQELTPGEIKSGTQEAQALNNNLDDKRGFVLMKKNFDGSTRENVIVLIKHKADKSTILHEFAHILSLNSLVLLYLYNGAILFFLFSICDIISL